MLDQSADLGGFRRLEGDQWVVTDPVLKDPGQMYGTAAADTAAAKGAKSE
jgi:hypothetical protein